MGYFTKVYFSVYGYCFNLFRNIMLDQIYSCLYLGINNSIFTHRDKMKSNTIQTGISAAF